MYRFTCSECGCVYEDDFEDDASCPRCMGGLSPDEEHICHADEA